MENVVSALARCGWIISTTADGYKCYCQSPQGLEANLFMEDLGHRLSLSYHTTITFRFESIDGFYVGQDQEIEIDPGFPQYQIVCGMCQLFISGVGISGPSPGGSSFCGGIPFRPDAAGTCGGQLVSDESVYQLFWSMGDFSGLGSDPRKYLIQANSQENCEALWNLVFSPAGIPISSVRMPAIVPAPYIFQGFNYPSETRWYWSGVDQDLRDFFVYEPLLCWGYSSGYKAEIRAQIWDAGIFSTNTPADTTRDFFGYHWLNWTHNYLYGGLNLRIPAREFFHGNHSAIAT